MLKEEFWPVSQAVDFVRATLNRTADAVKTELARYSNNTEDIASKEIDILSIKEMVQCFPFYSNTSTHILAITVNSDWTGILYNSFLCDGYDSLMHNLTRLFGLETIHISSHDKMTTFLPGSRFTYRSVVDGQIAKRDLSCSVNDSGRWEFFESGPRQNWEMDADYSARIKKERLNEKVVESFLHRIGINIYSSESLIFPLKAVIVSRPRLAKVPPFRTTAEVLLEYEES
jgi:hypothetical protein